MWLTQRQISVNRNILILKPKKGLFRSSIDPAL